MKSIKSLTSARISELSVSNHTDGTDVIYDSTDVIYDSTDVIYDSTDHRAQGIA